MVELFKGNRASIAIMFVAVLVTGLALTLFPAQRDLESLPEFILKLAPFVLAAEAVARLDLRGDETGIGGIIARLGLLISFLIFFAWFVPQVFFYLDEFEQVYVRMQFISPFFILVIALAYRLGGGASWAVRRIAFGLLIVMLSGIEDLAFLTINPHTDPEWSSIPEVWTWADHMKVRLGHYPTRNEAFAFIAAHLIVALAVFFVPSSWLRAAIRKLRPSRGTPYEALST